MNALADNLAAVRSAVAEAAARSGRSAADVEVLAVSKAQPPEAITEAMECGQLLFGENRVQEARAKIPLISSRARWHFIGHLQKNKIRQALPHFDLFHGVDSLELARDLDRVSSEAGAFPHILLEVNVAGEASKFGFSPDKLREQSGELLALPRLQIDGLMTIAPFASEPEPSRRYFAALREVRDQLKAENGVPFSQLSMGMSGDFIVAVEEGATIVRIGTAIFGDRRGKAWRPSGETASYVD